VISRVPGAQDFGRRLGVFELGEMEDPGYAYRVFRRHFDRTDLTRRPDGFVVLEIGPGDTLLTAVIAPAFGARSTILVDARPFARKPLAPYRAMAEFLRREGKEPPAVEDADSLAALLSICGARYETRGLESLKELPDRSVDFFFSQAVLEHVRRRDMAETLRQLRRVVRDDGVGCHRIDLSDHLSGALNNLRFAERLWESALMAGSGFYTNRLRYPELLRLFRETGFQATVAQIDRWDRLPTARPGLARQFQAFSDEDLSIKGFDVVLRPSRD
jgi:SAM-dependent methyltransferase